MKFDPMLTALCGLFVIIGLSFWSAQKRKDFAFDLFDILMENGKVSRIAVAFMLVLAVTTWIIINEEIKGRLTEGMFGLYLGAWVAPLVAKVIFGKTDAPGTTTVSSTTTVIKEPLQ